MRVSVTPLVEGVLPGEKSVLVALRNYTTLDRMLDVLPLLDSDPRLRLSWVIDPGSEFAVGFADYLAHMGITPVLSWQDTVARPFDLILAAHVDNRLGQLKGPLVVFPHGAGYQRILPSRTLSDVEPVGLSRHEHMTPDDEIAASVIGLSHENQRVPLESAVPGAGARALVIGDPTFDRIKANLPLRTEFRRRFAVARGQRLVVVTSTWGVNALVQEPDLVFELVAQLPLDEFKVVLVLHANVWARYGELGLRSRFRDALDSGLVLLKADNGWQAGIIAADLCIGDHGSVAFYAAALGRPFLRAAIGPVAVDPSSPTAAFIAAATPVDRYRDLHHQVVRAITTHQPEEMSRITSLSLGLPGDNGRTLRDAAYRLLDLPVPKTTKPRPVRFTAPEPITGHAMASVLVTLSTSVRTERSGRVDVRRHAAILERHHPPDDRRERILISRDDEIDQELRDRAEMALAVDPMNESEALGWLKRRLEQSGVKLAAAVVDSRYLLQLREGPLLEAQAKPVTASGPSPPALEFVAAATYAWLAEGKTFDDVVDLVVGRTESPADDVVISVVAIGGSQLTR